MGRGFVDTEMRERRQITLGELVLFVLLIGACFGWAFERSRCEAAFEDGVQAERRCVAEQKLKTEILQKQLDVAIKACNTYHYIVEAIIVEAKKHESK